ncbi:MAG: hypothetical protein GY822_06250 [Deltaproteobacteria bacterium]|nr:hypothetical protein [Deltaproteobacteria bacterium]
MPKKDVREEQQPNATKNQAPVPAQKKEEPTQQTTSPEKKVEVKEAEQAPKASLSDSMRKLPPFSGEEGSREAKAHALVSDVEAAWIDKERHPRELLFLCTQWLPDWIFKARPSLQNYLKLCEATAAFRLGDLKKAAQQSANLLSDIERHPLTEESLRTRAEAMLLTVRIEHSPLAEYEACGSKLGLSLLRTFEAESFLRSSKQATAGHRAVFEAGDPLQTLRALLFILENHAHILDKAYVIPEESFRGVALPSPLVTFSLSPKPNAQQKRQKEEWLTEYDRLARQAQILLGETAITQGLPHRNVQRADAQARLSLLAKRRKNLDDEPKSIATNPFAARVQDGFLVHVGKRFFVRKGEHWEPIAQKTARKNIGADLVTLAQLLEPPAKPVPDAPVKKAPVDAKLAYSLAASDDVSDGLLGRALETEDPLLRIAALVWIQHHPHEGHDKILLAHWRKHFPATTDINAAFSSLQNALFSEDARAILAFLSLAEKERDLALNLSYQNALPWSLRAWMLAELGDTRVRYRVQELVDIPDEEASAIALYGSYRANGERSLWLMNRRRAGIAGCVARHIQELHNERTKASARR